MRDFTTGNEGKLILNFAIPMLIGNIFMQLYQFADTVIVGRFLGKEALSAVGASTPVVFMTIALVIGIGVGSSVVISQFFGAKQYDKVQTTADTVFIVLLAMAFVVTLFGVFFSRRILVWMRLPEDVLPMAASYLRIYFSGSVLMFGYNAVAAMLRGIGDSKTPLIFLIISTLLNIGLDFLFILGFGWGVNGAAAATVAAQGAAFFFSVWYINRKKMAIRIELRTPKFDGRIFRQCIRLGLPTGLQQTFVAVGMLALMGIVNGFGTDVIAGYVAVSRLDTFVSLPVMNFAAALTNFTGQNIAVGMYDRIRRGLKATLTMSLATCVLINVVMILFARPLISIFTSDPAVIEIGREYLTIMNTFYILFAVMFAFNGVMRGAGAAVVPMITTLLSLWLIRIPAAAFLSRWLGETGIWWSVPIGWFVGMCGSIGYYYSGKWKNKTVFKAD